MTTPALQVGFGDVQVPGPLAPPVPEATSEGARVAVETDLTYIPQPPGTPVPLSVCADRAYYHESMTHICSSEPEHTRIPQSIDKLAESNARSGASQTVVQRRAFPLVDVLFR